MESAGKIIIVTGANRGIGLAITKELAKCWKGVIYFTGRSMDNLKKAVVAVKEIACPETTIKLHQLDISDQKSIDEYAKYMKDNEPGIDAVIHNAGIAYKSDDKTPFHIQAEHTIAVNYFGTINLCRALYPLLRPNARVVIVSSRAGKYQIIKDPELLKEFRRDSDKTVDDISEIMRKFVDSTKSNTHQEKGFPDTAYGMSKLGLTAATFAMQREFDADKRKGMIINACCPGYTKTDMTGMKGNLTAEEGAQTPVYLAMLPDGTTEPKGQFVVEKTVFEWI